MAVVLLHVYIIFAILFVVDPRAKDVLQSILVSHCAKTYHIKSHLQRSAVRARLPICIFPYQGP